MKKTMMVLMVVMTFCAGCSTFNTGKVKNLVGWTAVPAAVGGLITGDRKGIGYGAAGGAAGWLFKEALTKPKESNQNQGYVQQEMRQQQGPMMGQGTMQGRGDVCPHGGIHRDKYGNANCEKFNQ